VSLFKVVLTLSLSTLCFASGISLKYIKGSISIDRDGLQVSPVKSMSLLVGDTISTSRKSFALIVYDQGSHIKLDPNSSITITSLETNAKEGRKGLSIFLKAGQLMMDLLGKKDEHDVQIQTRTVALGVRGTKFLFADEEGQDIYASVDRGEIEILDFDNDDFEIIKEKESLLIEQGKTFTRPQRSEWTRSLNWDLNSQESTGFANDELRKKRHSEIRKKISKLRARKKKKFKHLPRYKNKFKKFTRNRQFLQKLKSKKQQRLQNLKVKRKNLRSKDQLKKNKRAKNLRKKRRR
jgi:hypothetical protein